MLLNLKNENNANFNLGNTRVQHTGSFLIQKKIINVFNIFARLKL